MVNPTLPKLKKSKSNIRLRLGIGSPSKTHKKQQQYDDNNRHLSPNDISPQYDQKNQLMSSTSTSNSRLSRTDSRSAFTYDYSSTPSPNHPQHQHQHQFDTISYNTISPESLLYQNANQNHSQPLIYGSSSTSENEELQQQYYNQYGEENDYNEYDDEEEDYDDDQQLQHITYSYESSNLTGREDGEEHHQPEPEIDNQKEIEETLHPAISKITLQTDDIFSLTDRQLSDKFKFISEIGFGNWGSVWLCKPKHFRNSFLASYYQRYQQFQQTQNGYVENINENAFIKLGKKSVVSGGTGACGKVAIKLVHRSRTATTAARVRALWGEMKIIRSLRHEPHPSIIQFEAFVITPSYALIIMPLLSQLIPVCLAPWKATPYFRQLASAVAYLHERGITHNDIKPANVLLSHNDIPVLVDFGFAQQWDVNARGSFLSSIAWGTPEYLDPIRAQGMPHDERASDVWSLGVTIFEILIGRTPFEENQEEEFMTPEDLLIYYERSKRGQWVGEWSMPEGLQNLLMNMINPDPAYRISAMQAYHHPALLPTAPSVIITPHFVRAATSFDEYQYQYQYQYQEEPLPVPPQEYTEAVKAAVGEKKKKRKVKKDGHSHHHKDHTSNRAVTPALGESIKQHTSLPRSKHHHNKDGNDKENIDIDAQRALSRLVIRKRAEDIKDKEDENDDPTPTKVLRPAQPLRIKELSLIADKKVVPRTSNSNLTNLSRPTSATSLNTTKGVLSHTTSTSTLKDKRVSVLSSSSTVPKSKEEAVLKTMKSLEGTRKLVHLHEKKEKVTEALSQVKRHAPDPPRPKSLDSAVELNVASSTVVTKKDGERRSLGLERTVLIDVQEEEIDIKVREGGKEVDTVVHFRNQEKVQPPMRAAQPMSPPREKRSTANQMPTPSPQKVRRAGPKPHAEMDTLRGKVFPASDDESPLAELRSKILVSDQEKLVRYRQASGDLGDGTMEILAPGGTPKAVVPAPTQGESSFVAAKEVRHSVDSFASTSISQATGKGITRTKSIEALEMDGRLDKMTNWIKSVENIIEDARKAIAEGREPPLPILSIPKELSNSNSNSDSNQKKFGLTPDKSLPAHLRTSSTQVEPSTPSKWSSQPPIEGNQMNDKIKEAEEKIQLANKWMEEQGRKGKKDRPTVSHVLKLFGTEKERPASGSRSNTPDIAHLVPLKPPATSSTTHALRGAPSTPALRSSTTRGLTRVPMRKSESNLRNFNTMPTTASSSFTAGPEYDPMSDNDDIDNESGIGSPRRVMFENLLSTEPGVIRQGEGWSSLSSGKGFMMGVKPSSSMASLRERAKALLGDNHNNKGERHITDLSKSHGLGGLNTNHKLEKRSSKLNLNLTKTTTNDKDLHLQTQRPNTPGAQSVLTLRTSENGKKGWLKSLKGAMGMGKKMDKLDEGL